MSRKKTRSEYESGLEKTLIHHFKNNIPSSKEDLAFRMTEQGYRRKKIYDKSGQKYYIDDQYPVSNKQIDYAWDFLQKNKPRQETLNIRFNFVKEQYGNRALENFTYNDKNYRKGQFVPKGVKNE